MTISISSATISYMSTAVERSLRPDITSLSDELVEERKWLSEACKDPEKFRFFYDKYARWIHNFIFRRTRDIELTEDLVALTFANALDHLKEFHWKGFALGSWFFRIAVNEIHKHQVKENRMLTIGSKKIQDNTPHPQKNPLASLIISEREQQLYECLRQLSQRDQDIFILFYWEGLKVREIADELCISTNTIKTRLKRGRSHLRKLIAGTVEIPDQVPPTEQNWGNDPDLRFAEWADTTPPKNLP